MFYKYKTYYYFMSDMFYIYKTYYVIYGYRNFSTMLGKGLIKNIKKEMEKLENIN